MTGMTRVSTFRITEKYGYSKIFIYSISLECRETRHTRHGVIECELTRRTTP